METGSVINGHCTCMAGYVCLLSAMSLFNVIYYIIYRLGEVFSHVAVLLSMIETACRLEIHNVHPLAT